MAEIERYPALVDVHVHYRQPGDNTSETIASGSEASAIGGFGYVFDMPNNPGRSTWTTDRVEEKHQIARDTSRIYYGAYAGWQPQNDIEPGELIKMAPYVVGKKDYLTKTTGQSHEWEVDDFMPGIRVFHEAAPHKPNMVHPANIDQVSQYIVDVAGALGHHVHICHVNDPEVGDLVARYRGDGYPVSSGITPHHVTKTSYDVHTHGKFAEMMPDLADQYDAEQLLWQLNQGIIDIVETDHAPHTRDAKMAAEHKGGDCFGVPGAELAFPILNYQVKKGRLTRERLIDAMSTRPAQIMGIRIGTDSYGEWDTEIYRIEDESEVVRSGAGWTPYLGHMAAGRLVRLVLSGKEVYRAGKNMQPFSGYGIDPVIHERQTAQSTNKGETQNFKEVI